MNKEYDFSKGRRGAVVAQKGKTNDDESSPS